MAQLAQRCCGGHTCQKPQLLVLPNTWLLSRPMRAPRSCIRARASRDGRQSREGKSLLNAQLSSVPTELLRADYAERQEHTDRPLTVYSCRFSTGYGRAAALSDSNSGVNVCLIGKDGRSVLHRISPINDPTETHHDVELMCQIIDDGVGADCQAALNHQTPNDTATKASGSKISGLPGKSSQQANSTNSSSSYTLPPKPPPQPRLRFQEGTVDEVVFLAPELGPLSGVLVGTECGSWILDELQVASSRSHHIDRFVCRQMLGVQPGQGAAFLTPVPPDVVVYGTGDAQVTLSKEQAAAIHTMNMDAYESLKQRMLTTTILLTASGSWVAGLAAGLEGAIPFALGGLAGVTYQWLLQQGVDGVVATVATPHRHLARGGSERPLSAGSSKSDGDSVPVDFLEVDSDGRVTPAKSQTRVTSSGGDGGNAAAAIRLRQAVSNPAFRLAFLAAATALTLSVVGVLPEDGVKTVPMTVPIQREQLWQLLVALLGFMTYKVALVSATLSHPPVKDVVNVGGSKSSSARQ